MPVKLVHRHPKLPFHTRSQCLCLDLSTCVPVLGEWNTCGCRWVRATLSSSLPSCYPPCSPGILLALLMSCLSPCHTYGLLDILLASRFSALPPCYPPSSRFPVLPPFYPPCHPRDLPVTLLAPQSLPLPACHPRGLPVTLLASLSYLWPHYHPHGLLDYMQTERRPPEPKPATVQLRFTRTAGISYWANTCTHCAAVQIGTPTCYPTEHIFRYSPYRPAAELIIWNNKKRHSYTNRHNSCVVIIRWASCGVRLGVQ